MRIQQGYILSRFCMRIRSFVCIRKTQCACVPMLECQNVLRRAPEDIPEARVPLLHGYSELGACRCKEQSLLFDMIRGYA